MCIGLVTLLILLWNNPAKWLTRLSQSAQVNVSVASSIGQAIAAITSETANIRIPDTYLDRVNMSPFAKIALFEKLGHIPKGFDIRDHVLAERCSWWGKRLDPKEFWKDRVVWYDDEAEWSARSRGRGYPPMPYDDPSVHDRSDEDMQGDGWTMEARMPRYVVTDRENVFWINFQKTHPNPPNHIQRWLDDNVDFWLGEKKQYDYSVEKGKPSRDFQSNMESNMTRAFRNAKAFCYPTECITPDAYHWEHVMHKRVEYENLMASDSAGNQNDIEKFFNRVYVDHALITEPLTQNQIDAANAWKVAYLNRLRSEQWDESYINAYLQAWNLSEEYVFGASPK